MSSLSWDFPASSTNPVDDDDIDGGDGPGRPDGASDDSASDSDDDDYEEIQALERQLLEQLERDQPGALLQEDLEQLGQPQALDGAEIELSERAEREQLEELEREQLRQLERLQRELEASADAPPPPEPPPARPEPHGREEPAAEAVDERAGIEVAQARAAQFLAAASARRAFDETASTLQTPSPATERRELNEPARAARVIVEHRHRNLVEANALLADARKVLAPIAYRGLSDRTYRRRKFILGIGEAVSLAVAFSAAFDVAPLEGLLLSGAIALAFVVAGDLGGVLRLTADRSRLSAALDDGVVQLDPRYLHVLYHDRQPWLSIVGGVTAAIFALATVSVGVLRAANQGSLGLAAGLGLLTVSLAIAAGLSSWQHASIGSEIIDHLQREEEAAARRLKRAAGARVLRRPQILSVVGSEDLEVASYAPDLDWQVPAPDVDWQAPNPEGRARRPRLAGRVPREKPARRDKPAKREKSSGGLLGAAAGRAAVFMASRSSRPSRPGRSRRSEQSADNEVSFDREPAGDGPGAGGESAGPISAVAFTPPVVVQKKFGRP